ncbi:MAG TPA: RpiB/LacA/LacB family sugar-phosphate isomerase [Candidatus Paceibacterota bacterium]|nr:RpiB/LacA/LacB family sugar-phosphate isomerase [Candidatus Paceibacterota bacterium]
MIIYIGADHRGFKLKEHLKKFLADKAYAVEDMGAFQEVPDDDFPLYARPVAEKVAGDPALGRGIVICGSGFGVDIVANKVSGVRAALASSPDHAYQARHDDDVNVLALAADFLEEEAAEKIVQVFLSTPFGKEEKYSRRLKEIGGMDGSA